MNAPDPARPSEAPHAASRTAVPRLAAALQVLRRGLGAVRSPLPLALLMLLLSLVMPAIPLQRDTVDAIVVFDVTQSMNVEDARIDGALVSRLDFAREAARRALSRLPCGSRVGWGAFAEYRTLVLLAPVEVCDNYNDLLASLSGIDGDIRWGNASEVSKGVFWALRAAKELPSSPGVVFMTDGHEAPPLGAASLPMFDDLKTGQVHGWLIGVGGLVPRPIPKTDAQGRRTGYWRAEEVLQRPLAPGQAPSHEHLSELHEPHLMALASQVGLDYRRLDSPAPLVEVLQDVRMAHSARVPTDLRWIPAALALLVLAWHFRPDRTFFASTQVKAHGHDGKTATQP